MTKGLIATKAKQTKEATEQLLTRRQVATLLAVHPMTVTKWEQDGLPIAERGRKGKPSLYREVEVRAWLAAREEAAKQGAPMDLLKERAYKEHWQGLLAEQQHKIRQRDLLPRDEVEKLWGAEVAAVRTKLLSWATTLADRVHRASTIDGLTGVERALQDAVRDVLRELSDPKRPPSGVAAA